MAYSAIEFEKDVKLWDSLFEDYHRSTKDGLKRTVNVVQGLVDLIKKNFSDKYQIKFMKKFALSRTCMRMSNIGYKMAAERLETLRAKRKRVELAHAHCSPPKKQKLTEKAKPAKKAAPRKKAAPKKKAEPKKKATPKKKAAPKKKAMPKKKVGPKKKGVSAKKEGKGAHTNAKKVLSQNPPTLSKKTKPKNPSKAKSKTFAKPKQQKSATISSRTRRKVTAESAFFIGENLPKKPGELTSGEKLDSFLDGNPLNKPNIELSNSDSE